ncbi:flavin reductase family protein [Candidatus Bipolaricaulota bacterium]|nr:flavin reductase family protein [Candidatus Bipolaricaulota bacterium]
MLREIPWEEAIKLASPYPYALALTVDKKGKPNAMGLGWWSYVSWEPPMIAIAVGPERYSYECLECCGEFVLCFPAEDQGKGAWYCGTVSGRGREKLAEAGLKTIPAKVVRPPLIEGATVCYECRVREHVPTGDHVLFIADVVAIHGEPTRPKHLYSIGYERLTSLSHRDA